MAIWNTTVNTHFRGYLLPRTVYLYILYNFGCKWIVFIHRRRAFYNFVISCLESGATGSKSTYSPENACFLVMYHQSNHLTKYMYDQKNFWKYGQLLLWCFWNVASHCWLLVCTFFTKMSRQEFINESQCKRIIDMIKNDYKAYI